METERCRQGEEEKEESHWTPMEVSRTITYPS